MEHIKSLNFMLTEVNLAQKWIKENYGENPSPGSYAILYKSKKGNVFMKVTIDEKNCMNDFHLYLDKDLTIDYYTAKPIQYVSNMSLKDFHRYLEEEAVNKVGYDKFIWDAFYEKIIALEGDK